jgi:hypothetical protein
MDQIVFFEPTDCASQRTIQKINLYGSKGWHIVMKKDSVYCLHNKQAGTLVISIDFPKIYYQAWRGWLPTSEIKVIG